MNLNIYILLHYVYPLENPSLFAETNPFSELHLKSLDETISFNCLFFCLFLVQQAPPTQWARASSFKRFLDHTQRPTTVGRTSLDEWSARRRDLYLTTHNTHNRQTAVPRMGFEPTISAWERPQTYALDSAAAGIGTYFNYITYILKLML